MSLNYRIFSKKFLLKNILTRTKFLVMDSLKSYVKDTWVETEAIFENIGNQGLIELYWHCRNDLEQAWSMLVKLDQSPTNT